MQNPRGKETRAQTQPKPNPFASDTGTVLALLMLPQMKLDNRDMLSKHGAARASEGFSSSHSFTVGNANCGLDGFPANTALGLPIPSDNKASLNKNQFHSSQCFLCHVWQKYLAPVQRAPGAADTSPGQAAHPPTHHTAAPAGALPRGSTAGRHPRVVSKPSLSSAYESFKNYVASFVLGITLITLTSTTLFYLPSFPWFLALLQSGSQPLDQRLSFYLAQHKRIPGCDQNLKEWC